MNNPTEKAIHNPHSLTTAQDKVDLSLICILHDLIFIFMYSVRCEDVRLDVVQIVNLVIIIL